MKRHAAVAFQAKVARSLRRYLSTREALADVPADLRTLRLAVLLIPYAAKTLPFFRAVSRFRTNERATVTVTKRMIGERDISALVLSPSEGRQRPAVLWIHGGGYTVGSPQAEAMGGGRLARDLGAVVVLPAYRLAPVHPFPAALDDCMATLRWMRDQADELGVDPARIAVIGASSGGGLAAALAQRCFDEGFVLRAQALVYPMLDDRTTLTADHGVRGRLLWTPVSNRFAWTAYLGHEPRMSDAPDYAAPARRTDVTGLPPAWIGVGELDLFYGEAVVYTESLSAADVPCTLVTVPGMYHGADEFAPKAKAMQEFRRSVTDHLRMNL